MKRVWGALLWAVLLSTCGTGNEDALICRPGTDGTVCYRCPTPQAATRCQTDGPGLAMCTLVTCPAR